MGTSDKIEAFISDYPDWRGERLAKYRQLIHEEYPDIEEEFKWGVPIFTVNKMVLGISAFKDHVKINFFQGAHLADPDQLFNSGLDSKQHRSINVEEEDRLDETALRRLVQSAIALDQSHNK